MGETRQMESMIVVGIDVGVRNLAICEINIAIEGSLRQKTRLEKRATVIENTTIGEWVCLDAMTKCKKRKVDGSFEVVSAVLHTLAEHDDLFARADHVVVEQQIGKMKSVCYGIIGFLMGRYPNLNICVQSSRAKLNWTDCKAATYAERKKEAVSLCTVCTAGMNKSLALCTKKDDLADSFLHAIAFAVSHPVLLSSRCPS